MQLDEKWMALDLRPIQYERNDGDQGAKHGEKLFPSLMWGH